MKKTFDCVEMQRKLRENINEQYGTDHHKLIQDLQREVGFKKKERYADSS